MKDRKARECCVCQNSYSYCPKCNEDKNKPTWYFSFCSENCKNIYSVTSQFENNVISKDEAIQKLAELDISGLENFGNSYKNSIAKIQKNNSVSVTKKKTKRSFNTKISEEIKVDELD